MKTDQKLPRSKLAEQRVLGEAILEPKYVMPILTVQLNSDHFYWRAHQEIYKAITGVYKENNDLDENLVYEYLKTQGKIDRTGGRSYLIDLVGKVTTATEIEHYVQIVKDRASKRYLLKQITELGDFARNGKENGEILSKLDGIKEGMLDYSTSKDVDGSVLVKAFQRSKEEDAESGRAIWQGITWGYDWIDEKIGGLQAGSFSLLIGVTRGMKTLFTCATALKQAQQNIPVGYVSIEMSELGLAHRFLQNLTGVYLEDLYEEEIDFDRYLTNLDIYPWKFLFYKNSLDVISNQITEWVMKHGTKMIYIDYLQLIKVDSYGDKQERGAEILTRLKSLAGSLDVPILMNVQVPRQDAKEKNLSVYSTKYYGDAENHADKVLLLRPEWDKLDDSYKKSMKLTLEVGKDRISGKAGQKVIMKGIRKSQRIEFKKGF